MKTVLHSYKYIECYCNIHNLEANAYCHVHMFVYDIVYMHVCVCESSDIKSTVKMHQLMFIIRIFLFMMCM